jgi:hypothetical protein
MVNEWGARVHALAGGDKLLFVEGIPNEVGFSIRGGLVAFG